MASHKEASCGEIKTLLKDEDVSRVDCGCLGNMKTSIFDRTPHEHGIVPYSLEPVDGLKKPSCEQSIPGWSAIS